MASEARPSRTYSTSPGSPRYARDDEYILTVISDSGDSGPMKNISFKKVTYKSAEYQAALDLRHDVLGKPLGLNYNLAKLCEEENQIHCAAFYGPDLIATASLALEENRCKIRQVAIKTAYKKQGIGSRLLEFSETIAKSEGFNTIYCHAHDRAVFFYEKNNYVSEGPYFYEAGIAHLTMIKILNS